jgi:hypothetical protein
VELVAIIVSSSGIFRMNQGGQYSDLPVARVNCHFSNQPSWGAVFTNSLQLVGNPESVSQVRTEKSGSVRGCQVAGCMMTRA